MSATKKEIQEQKEQRVGETKYNKQGCLMKIVEYNKSVDIIVEFQDEFKGKVKTTYNNFKKLDVRNPYYPNVLGVGIRGNKYPAKTHYKNEKEYNAWTHILERCFDEKYKTKKPTYKDVTCCKEWLLYENFYEWLHNQENFKQWLNGRLWAIDKDILVKGNKIYSPDTCCLVPPNINSLFIKSDASRSNLPIGVYKNNSGFHAYCQNPLTNIQEYSEAYLTPETAFLKYKDYKEGIIKQVAKNEYGKGNITKQCYDAMINYQVEITD